MSVLEASVRDAIARYLAMSLTIDELADRLPDGWEMDEADDPVATRLVLQVMGLIAEVQAGDRSEPELQREIEDEASWRLDSTTSADSITTVLGQSVTAVVVEYAGGGTPLSTASWS